MLELDQLPIAVIVLDRDTTITVANDAAASLIGAEVTDLVGRKVFDAMRPRTATGEDLLCNGWSTAALLRSVRRVNEQEVVLRRSDGTEIEVVVDGGYERNAAGELVGATLLLRRRHRGARRPRSGVRVVSAVSHELRSPLTSVRGYTSLLLKQWDLVEDEDRRAMLSQIDRDARRISRMINELLDISRIESGRVQLNRREIDVRPVTVDVIDKVRMSYPELEVALQFPHDLPLVWADVDKVEQVLTNLIENACKYASPKGIEISATFDRDRLTVAVSDRGKGVPPHDVPRLFQQFFRPKEGRPTGTGLGLWISRGLIEAHGGTLTAESTPGEGSVFRFSLPLGAFEEAHGPEHRL